MSILSKSTTELLIEACNMPVDNHYMSNSDIELLGKISHIIELDEPFQYVIQAVPVLKESTIDGDRYLVEYDIMTKYMESNGITDIGEAMNILCTENEISLENTILVFESKKDLVDKAKKLGKEQAAKVNKTLEDIKSKGIKVACKSKKKCKK